MSNHDTSHTLDATAGATSSAKTPGFVFSDPSIPAAEIRRALADMIGNEDFPATERNRRALQYVVECALDGRAEDITAALIAKRVYGRPNDFDPIKDPIVRIEMARLRRDIETYYLKSGRNSSLRISIPRGSYYPHVVRPKREEVDSPAWGPSPFLVSVLRAALCAWSADREGASAAWQDLKLADQTWPANLQVSVAAEVGDEKVVRLIVEGALRAGRWADGGENEGAPSD
jgi:hypothetical protein